MTQQRRALVVGIDSYDVVGNLFGCVNDASSVRRVLERNDDDGQSKNFDVMTLEAADGASVEKLKLRQSIKQLFADDCEVALFFFAGHGHAESTGGYILASDSKSCDDGVPLTDVIAMANQSNARNKIIILDSCHAGAAGRPPGANHSELAEGLTILAASTQTQYANEQDGSGVFTSLLVDALEGAAADLLGRITPGSIYAHIDQSLGAWDQRPVFKTNIKAFVSIRSTRPRIPEPELRLISQLFPRDDFQFPLNPAYEPEERGREPGMPPPEDSKVATFKVLQKYNRHGLVIPVGASEPHMWHAAMESKHCCLTSLGRHYRKLAAKSRF